MDFNLHKTIIYNLHIEIMKKIFLLTLIPALYFSCENDDVTGLTSTDNFPTATVSYTGPTSAVSEEDGSLTFGIELSKPIESGTTFTINQVSGTAERGQDYDFSNVIIPAFSTNGTLNFDIIDNDFPAATRTLSFEVTTPEFGVQLLNPNSNVPFRLDLDITDVNPANVVNAGLAWNHDDASDLDMYLFDNAGNAVTVQATGDDPEIAVLLTDTDPDGTYYITVDAYTFTNAQININFGLSDGAGNVTEYVGVFDTDNLAQYTSEFYPPFGTTSYRVVEVTKVGTNYTFTKLF